MYQKHASGPLDLVEKIAMEEIGCNLHSCVQDYISKVVYLDNTKFAFAFPCK
jgi:hypothetical protein